MNNVADWLAKGFRIEGDHLVRVTEAPRPPAEHTTVEPEAKLQDRIDRWCRAQWPVWLVLRQRMDRKSNVAIGAHDLTIFAPGGRLLLIECKTGKNKLTPEQRNWRHMMAALGHEVHEVRSVEEFILLAGKSK